VLGAKQTHMGIFLAGSPVIQLKKGIPLGLGFCDPAAEKVGHSFISILDPVLGVEPNKTVWRTARGLRHHFVEI